LSQRRLLRASDLTKSYGRRVVVRDGELTTVDLGPLLERHNRLARQLAAAPGRR